MAAEATEAGTSGITREDLAAWHKKYWGSNNAILVVSGDFKKAEMLKKLEAVFGKWAKTEKAVPPIPKVAQAAKAGVYMVQPADPGQPGHHPDRPPRPQVGRSRLSRRRFDELHPGRRILLVAHHQGRPDRQRPGLLDELGLFGRRSLSGRFLGFLPDQEQHGRLRLPVDAGPDRRDAGAATSRRPDLDFARTARVESFPATFATTPKR